MRSIRNVSVACVGGAGFLGSHLTDFLIDNRSCDVLVIDNLVAGRREWVHPKATFHHHDITGSEDHLRKVFLEHGVKFVFNLAAWPYIVDSFSRPLHVFEVNANGAIKVINAAQEAGCEGVLQWSSAELYGAGKCGDAEAAAAKGFTTNITEDRKVEPHSTYGAAKAAVDYYCQTAWRERKTPVIALRQFNVVGERESHDYVIPTIISQLDKQRVWEEGYPAEPFPDRVPERGTVRLGNNSFRDFLYAGDAVRTAVELLERGSFGEVYNLGSETGIKMYDLAKLIGKLMGFESVEVIEDPARKRPWEIWHLQSDNTKLYRALSHEGEGKTLGELSTLWPRMSLEEALRRTIRWFEENNRRWPWE